MEWQRGTREEDPATYEKLWRKASHFKKRWEKNELGWRFNSWDSCFFCCTADTSSDRWKAGLGVGDGRREQIINPNWGGGYYKSSVVHCKQQRVQQRIVAGGFPLRRQDAPVGDVWSLMPFIYVLCQIYVFIRWVEKNTMTVNCELYFHVFFFYSRVWHDNRPRKKNVLLL